MNNECPVPAVLDGAIRAQIVQMGLDGRVGDARILCASGICAKMKPCETIVAHSVRRQTQRSTFEPR